MLALRTIRQCIILGLRKHKDGDYLGGIAEGRESVVVDALIDIVYTDAPSKMCFKSNMHTHAPSHERVLIALSTRTSLNFWANSYSVSSPDNAKLLSTGAASVDLATCQRRMGLH